VVDGKLPRIAEVFIAPGSRVAGFVWERERPIFFYIFEACRNE